jgi:hypothetical protein
MYRSSRLPVMDNVASNAITTDNTVFVTSPLGARAPVPRRVGWAPGRPAIAGKKVCMSDAMKVDSR